MSITKQIFLGRVVNGIAWILVGCFGLFDTIVFNVLESVALVASILCLIKVLTMQKVLTDEMSDYHYMAAKADALSKVYMILYGVLILAMLAPVVLQNLQINAFDALHFLLFVILGLGDVFVGMKFKKLEEE